MRNQINTVLIIDGADPRAYARGEFNGAMADTAKSLLEPHFDVLTTRASAGYEVAEEIAKFKAADVVIYQYPVFWFMVPAQLKKYMDDVFAYGDFFTYSDGPYGSGGLMHGKKVLFSTTWNAPEQAFNNTDAFFDGMRPTDAILAMRKAHQYCGFEELQHFSAHNVVQSPEIDTHIARLRHHLRVVFELDNETVAA